MAYFRKYTVARRLSRIMQGCTMEDASAWAVPGEKASGVSFTIADADTHKLIQVTLNDEELDRLIACRQTFRDVQRANVPNAEMGPGQ